jgi:hypothetical protein
MDPITVIYEIPSMDETQGYEFLSSMSSKSFSSDTDLICAKTLSERLGGLPLALTIMAMQMRKKSMSMQQFLIFYNQHEKKLHSTPVSLKPYYRHNLATAWELSFQSLNDSARTIFSIICIIAPDAIPTDLFHPKNQTELPRLLSFCTDSWE